MGIELHPRYSLVTVAYMAGIFLLSSIPDRGVGNDSIVVRLASNLIHIPLYAGLTFFFVQAVARGKADRTPLWAPYWIAFLGTAVYAALDEWHQSSVSGRYPSVSDVLLDLGGILGMLFFLRHRASRVARS